MKGRVAIPCTIPAGRFLKLMIDTVHKDASPELGLNMNSTIQKLRVRNLPAALGTSVLLALFAMVVFPQTTFGAELADDSRTGLRQGAFAKMSSRVETSARSGDSEMVDVIITYRAGLKRAGVREISSTSSDCGMQRRGTAQHIAAAATVVGDCFKRSTALPQFVLA